MDRSLTFVVIAPHALMSDPILGFNWVEGQRTRPKGWKKYSDACDRYVAMLTQEAELVMAAERAEGRGMFKSVVVNTVIHWKRASKQFTTHGEIKEGYLESSPLVEHSLVCEIQRAVLYAFSRIVYPRRENVVSQQSTKVWDDLAGRTVITVTEKRPRDIDPVLKLLPEQLELF